MDPNTQDPQAQPEQQPAVGAQQPPAQPVADTQAVPQPEQMAEPGPMPQPVEPTPQPAMQPAATLPPTPPKKSKKGLIIAIVIVAALLLLGAVGAGAYFVLNGAKNATTTSSTTKSDSSEDTAHGGNNAITATSESQYSIVCDGGTIKNAAASGSPYKITTFYMNDGRTSWDSLSVGYGEAYAPDYEKPEEINIVACLEAKEGTEAKANTCEFKSDGETLSLDYYSLQYQLTYYEAKTGKKVGKNDSVAGPGTVCPFSALLKNGETKLYADPDSATVEGLHKAFSTAS